MEVSQRRRKRASKRPHGLGTVYRQPGRRTWSVSWREKGERKYSHGFLSEELARGALAVIVNEVQRGRAGLPPDLSLIPTLSELATPWLERRQTTHRSWRDDRNRWRSELDPYFGKYRPHEVTESTVRGFVEEKLKKLAPNTVGNCVRLLSTFYTDLVERKLAPANVVKSLPRSTRRLYRSDHDPKDTPFLKSLEDIRRVFQALEEPVNVAFAIGALAGLRTGEVLALEWNDIDFSGKRIHVQRQARHGKVGPLKDSESRIVPLQNALVPILISWKGKTGGEGLVLKPAVANRGGRIGSAPHFVQIHTLHAALKKALKVCKIQALTWYEASRHTFASQWVLGAGSLEQLRELLGHDSVTTTERYSHLRPDHFRDADYSRLAVDLSGPFGSPLANNTKKKGTKKKRNDSE